MNSHRAGLRGSAYGDRRLRFELLEGRLLMSANASTTVSDSLIVPPTALLPSDPTMLVASVDPSASASVQPQVAGTSQAVVQQPDGKILVAGVNNGGFEIARYNSDGTQDTTFGTGGVTSFGNLNLQQVQQIKLQSDGSFYVLGEAPVSGTSSDQIPDAGGGQWWLSPPEITTVIHGEADGSVDTSYGNGGLLSLDTPAILPSATIQNDGKIVVASEAASGAISVVRYDTDGTLDTSFHFDQSGLPFVGLDAGGPIMVDSQGRIVLTGESANGLHLMRLNSDGSVDTTFGSSGDISVSLDPGWTGQLALAQQPDGKILLATTTVDQSSGFESYELTD